MPKHYSKVKIRILSPISIWEVYILHFSFVSSLYAEWALCRSLAHYTSQPLTHCMCMKVHYCHLDLEMCAESMRHAHRGITSASGPARALEAANSHTKRHGRRNKKSPPCEYCRSVRSPFTSRLYIFCVSTCFPPIPKASRIQRSDPFLPSG